jgi:hypothetical protein
MIVLEGSSLGNDLLKVLSYPYPFHGITAVDVKVIETGEKIFIGGNDDAYSPQLFLQETDDV